MEKVKGIGLGLHALVGRRLFGLSILIAVVTISVCSSAVFKSSIAQKMVEKNPDLMQVVMLLSQNRLMKIMLWMQPISDEMLRELRERVYE